MPNKFEKKAIVNFPVAMGKYELFKDTILQLATNKEAASVYFANVHMYIEAYKSEDFLKQIINADIVAPDGQPLVWMLRLLYGIKQDRVAGMDLFPDLLKGIEQKGIPVYFYGGTQDMLDKTNDYLKINYPGLNNTGMYSPPFKPLTESEEAEIVQKINAAFPAIVFVVLGCPRQEKWVATMKGKINAVMIAIGGALPVAIGIQKRAPVWMRRFGLEWLFRLFQEPKRLFKRYVTTNTLFIWVMFKEFLKLRILVPLKIYRAKKDSL